MIICFSDQKKSRSNVAVLKSRPSLANQTHYNIQNIYAPDGAVKGMKNKVYWTIPCYCLYFVSLENYYLTSCFTSLGYSPSMQSCKSKLYNLLFLVFTGFGLGNPANLYYKQKLKSTWILKTFLLLWIAVNIHCHSSQLVKNLQVDDTRKVLISFQFVFQKMSQLVWSGFWDNSNFPHSKPDVFLLYSCPYTGCRNSYSIWNMGNPSFQRNQNALL